MCLVETNNHSTGWMDKEREQNLQTTTAPASTLNPFTKNVDKYANGTKVNINNGMEQKNKQRGDAHKGEEAIDEAMPFRDQFAHNLFTAVANTAMNASIDSIDAFTQFRNQSDAEKELFPLPPTVNSFASENFQAEEDAIMSNASQALAANRSGITHRQFGLPLFLHGFIIFYAKKKRTMEHMEDFSVFSNIYSFYVRRELTFKLDTEKLKAIPQFRI